MRNAIFQLHWLLGITAGLVLALVGATGAMLSFEDAILERLNPGVLRVEPRGERLAPAQLVERVAAQRPGDIVASLTMPADPRGVARVAFAPKEDGGGRGERRTLDPYTGALLPSPRGEGFFRTTMQLHRWLAADDAGKQVVAASTVALVFFCLSGLYLRWPRGRSTLRTWRALDWKQRGRAFLWRQHAVVGTWVLLAYLVMALTGLWWSYGWYRATLESWADRPEAVAVAADAPAGPLDVQVAWEAFEQVAPAWSEATINFPRDGGAVTFRYLDADPTHERARNQLSLDPATLAVVAHERYDEGTFAQRLVGGIFALHRGSWFGPVGTWVFMLASAAMPLFAITGWMLYLDRRRKRNALQRSR